MFPKKTKNQNKSMVKMCDAAIGATPVMPLQNTFLPIGIGKCR